MAQAHRPQGGLKFPSEFHSWASKTQSNAERAAEQKISEDCINLTLIFLELFLALS